MRSEFTLQNPARRIKDRKRDLLEVERALRVELLHR